MKCSSIIFVAVLVAFASARELPLKSDGINAKDDFVSFDDNPMSNSKPRGPPGLGGEWKLDSNPSVILPRLPEQPQRQSNRNQKRATDTYSFHRKRGDKMDKNEDFQSSQQNFNPM